jgi:hypothetical protein
MISCKEYSKDITTPFRDAAYNRKTELRLLGFRVKILKNTDGQYEVHKKNIYLLDQYRGGNSNR